MRLLFKLILLMVGVLLAANSLTLDQAARDHVGAVSTAAAAAPATEALYKQKCSKCHGADGAGETSLGRVYGAPDFTDAGWRSKHPSSEFVGVISRGKKNMPAFGKKLTRAQISSLATYIQRFK
jgi:mono/diheme cytochrome c family protein